MSSPKIRTILRPAAFAAYNAESASAKSCDGSCRYARFKIAAPIEVPTSIRKFPQMTGRHNACKAVASIFLISNLARGPRSSTANSSPPIRATRIASPKDRWSLIATCRKHSSRSMAKPVIDRFEVVEIDERESRNRDLAKIVLAEFVAAFLEYASIGQSRQGITLGELPQTFP